MCLYPKFIRNPKYKPNKKNKGYYVPPTDARVLRVPVGCGKCIECRKQKARNWQIRLQQELKKNIQGYFVTMTFSEESLKEIENKLNVKECNAVAGYAIRKFLERWRKKYKKSLRHWLITELGHQGTERIHVHGIIFTNETFNNEILFKYWKYGITFTGTYCNEKTINYVVKYVTKLDIDHKGFEGEIYCSSGIGDNWTRTNEFTMRMYRPKNTIEYMTMENGTRVNMPIYYRNKRYSEEEREQLWLEKLDKHVIYVCGIKCDVSTIKGINKYNEILKGKQEDNEKLGYGNDNEEWKKKEYNTTLRQLNITK